nr:MAG TPA: hypothetical protein [Caudoviricetes sp.]
MAKPKNRIRYQDEAPIASMFVDLTTGSLNDIEVNSDMNSRQRPKSKKSSGSENVVDQQIIRSICEGIESNLIPLCYAVVGETTTGRWIFDRELFIQLLERFGYDQFHSEAFVDSFESAYDAPDTPLVMTRSASLMIMNEIPEHSRKSSISSRSSSRRSSNKKNKKNNKNNKKNNNNNKS